MAEMLAPVRPGLVLVDGEQELSDMAAATWSDVPVQRCLFHLSKAVQHLSRYTDRVPLPVAEALRARFDDTFLTHPAAGRLLFGDKGRPELGTGVLERVMRETNRRTDVGVRWSLHGARAILMAKLEPKYHHGQHAPKPERTTTPAARFTLAT